MFEQGSAIRCVNEIRVVSKAEFDKMWFKALPANRRSEITLPVLNVVQGGVYFIMEGSLQTMPGEKP